MGGMHPSQKVGLWLWMNPKLITYSIYVSIYLSFPLNPIESQSCRCDLHSQAHPWCQASSWLGLPASPVAKARAARVLGTHWWPLENRENHGKPWWVMVHMSHWKFLSYQYMGAEIRGGLSGRKNGCQWKFKVWHIKFHAFWLIVCELVQMAHRNIDDKHENQFFSTCLQDGCNLVLLFLCFHVLHVYKHQDHGSTGRVPQDRGTPKRTLSSNRIYHVHSVTNVVAS